MSKKISAGIGLDGEKEFRQAVNAINGDLNVLKSEMKKVTSEFIDNEKSMESLNAKQDVYNKQIAAQTTKVATLKEALENAKKEYGENSKQVQSWQIKLNNAEADLNKMNKELADVEKQAAGIDKVNDEFNELDKKVQNAENEVEDINKDLEDTKEQGVALGKILPSSFKAIGTAIGVAVTAASGLLTTYLSLTESGTELDRRTTQLCIAFEQVGMSEGDAADALYELYGVLGDKDKATEATLLLAKMSENEEDVTNITRILTGVFALYGDSIPTEVLAEGMQATAKMGEVQGILADALEWQGINLDNYNEKLAKFTTEEERAAYIQETLNELYGESADEYRLLNAELIAANEAQLEFEENIAAIGKTAIPVKTTLTEFANGIFNDVYMPIENFGFALNGLLNGEEDSADRIASSVSEIFDSLFKNLEKILPIGIQVITKVAPELLKSFSKSLLGNSDFLLSSVLTLTLEISNTLLNMLPEISKIGVELLTSLMLGIADATPELVPSIVSVVEEMVLILSDPETLTSLLTAGLSIITSLGSSLIDAIPQLIDTAFEVIENIATFLLDEDNLLMVANAAISIVTKLGTSLVGAIPDLLTNVGTLITDVVAKFGETDWSTIGSDLIEGIKSGITEAWETFKAWVSEKFESLKTGVKELFDINSPSRWAKDEIMGNVMLGFGLGIEENEDEVRKQMDEFTATLTDDVEYDLNARNITARIVAAEPPAEILSSTYSKTGTSGSDDKFDRMLALLEIIAINSKKDIVLDKKTLVGELAPEMNEELGAIYALAERGD